MRLEDITINNIGCIKHLVLGNLNPTMNVVTGPNGVGKTTLLKSICSILTTPKSIHLTRNSRSEEGQILGSLYNGVTSVRKTQQIKAFAPDAKDLDEGFNKVRNVIYISDNREFNYVKLGSIPRDIIKSDYEYANNVINSINPEQIKGWFINRFLFSAQPDSLTESQISNFELAKRAFSCLDSSVCFNKVDSRTLDIILATSFGPIYFEYLSSGFKSLIILILGIIKEIEFRFGDSNMKVAEFDGVIIIDEIDVHLHPTWQAQIINVLREIFPNVQFFVSTHSPHVVQSLPQEQLIALEKVEDNIVRRVLPYNESGYIGWTIEEVLRDVMGMTNTNTSIFHDLWEQFTTAIENENSQKAHKLGQMLLGMLHPANVLRKVIELQLTALPND